MDPLIGQKNLISFAAVNTF